MTMSLVQLQMLARERVPSKRHQLLREVVDAFFDKAQARGIEARELFEDVVGRILAEVEPVARQELAERLACRADAPRRLVMQLAGDMIAVAAPLLIHSQVLEDDDLAPLAAEKSQDHLLAIAKRAQLSGLITDILVGRGDDRVLGCLVENLGARFSRSGATTLVERAVSRPSLLRRLAGRADLALHMPETSKAATVVGIPGRPQSGANQDLRDSMTARLEAAAARARSITALAALIAAGTLTLCEAVIELADADRVGDLALLICGHSDLESHDFVRNLFAPDVMPLMKQCRGAGLALEAFSAVLRLRRRRLAFAAGAIGWLLRAYQTLSDPAPPRYEAAVASAHFRA
jgi:uncharacterized protein (DUF2336 family)